MKKKCSNALKASQRHETNCSCLTLKANIQSIMASEKQVNTLMQLLDEALGEVDTIEGKLSSYEEMLQSVKDQMDQISQSNRLIQISNANNGKMLNEIQFLVVRNDECGLEM